MQEDYLKLLREGSKLPVRNPGYPPIRLAVLSDNSPAQLTKRFAKYEEVASSVYMNPEYMRKYMIGLAITSFLWPNHAKMRDFFLQTIPRDSGGEYMEIGPGHGFYFMKAMALTQYDYFRGVDISPTSVEMTSKIVASSLPCSGGRYTVDECDFLEFKFSRVFDAIVMGEVLEHVEDPGAFLRRIAELAAPGAYIFVTTCINSPAFDHIFLFHSVEHLEEFFATEGLAVTDSLILPYHGTTLEQSVQRSLPINVAYLLKRK